MSTLPETNSKSPSFFWGMPSLQVLGKLLVSGRGGPSNDRLKWTPLFAIEGPPVGEEKYGDVSKIYMEIVSRSNSFNGGFDG